MADYSKMTNDEFDSILSEIIGEMTGDQLLAAVPTIYPDVSEEFNNEILFLWEQRNSEDKA